MSSKDKKKDYKEVSGNETNRSTDNLDPGKPKLEKLLQKEKGIIARIKAIWEGLSRLQQFLSALFGILAIGGSSYGIYTWLTVGAIFQPITYENVQFNFQVYCPMNESDFPRNELRRLGNRENNTIPSYTVYMVSQYNNETGKSRLYYCGNLTTWENKNCSKHELIKPQCTYPGPLFYVEKNKPIDVLWFNQIGKTVNSTTMKLEPDLYPLDKLPNKSNDIDAKVHGQKLYTYEDPTFINNTKTGLQCDHINFDKYSLPVTTHVHGLEVRPTFDGNPLSWNNGERIGVGFQSLEGKEPDNINDYYSFFNENFATAIKSPSQYKHLTKVNRYMNTQPPGNLWYHDHGMRSTQYNVQNGLSGVYIIYDKEVEAQLPSEEFEKFLLITSSNNVNTNVTNWIYTGPPQDQSAASAKSSASPQNGTSPPLTQTDPFKRRPYRFRLLNANIGGSISLIGFSYIQNDTETKLNMSIVGADTTLFRESIDNIKEVQLAGAERLEVVVDLSQIPKTVMEFSLKTFNKNATGTSLVNYTLPLTNDVVPLPMKSHYSLNVNYTDLTTMTPDVKRMRSMAVSTGFLFNTHHMFTMGASENPKIGTVEDWYIINGMTFGHPVHVHLINFQVVNSYIIKLVPNNDGCTYYMVDQIKKINSTDWKKMSMSQLCDIANDMMNQTYKISYTLPNGTYVQKASVYSALYHFNLENDIDSTTKISGLNVMEKTNKTDISQNYPSDPNQQCDNDLSLTHKYICKDTTTEFLAAKPWYRRWKDTAMIDGLNVLVYRMRWASTERPNPLEYPYFHIGEDQLTEFPGFIYHCHILSHEDNELMRPIMLQLSDHFVKYVRGDKEPIGDCRSPRIWTWDWKDRVKCINQKVKPLKPQK